MDCPIIAVTGTNGKTSVTNCIAQLFEKSGKNIIINREGNNLDTGICSLLLRHCDMSGRVKADYLILETDESHVPVVYSQMKLETLVVLNFFRDQLDRNGEMETLIQKINGFCKTFDGNLILNGDDPIQHVLDVPIPKTKTSDISTLNLTSLLLIRFLRLLRDISVLSVVNLLNMNIISIPT